MTADGMSTVVVANACHVLSPTSLACGSAAPREIIASSRDAAWSCLLVERYRFAREEQAFETLPTQDQRLVVTVRGERDVACYSGRGWRTAIYRPGTVGMTPGGQGDRLSCRPQARGEPFETITLYLPQSFFIAARDRYARTNETAVDRPLDALAFNDPMIAQAALSLERAAETGAPELYAETVAQWLAIHLLARHSPWLSPELLDRDEHVVSDRRIARVLDYMSAHFAEPLTLETLAREAGVSRFHFVRIFRRATAVTPHAHLLRLRLLTARRLLLTTTLPVAMIASRCGFARPTHFSTSFARAFGEAPGALRRTTRRADRSPDCADR